MTGHILLTENSMENLKQHSLESPRISVQTLSQEPTLSGSRAMCIMQKDLYNLKLSEKALEIPAFRKNIRLRIEDQSDFFSNTRNMKAHRHEVWSLSRKYYISVIRCKGINGPLRLKDFFFFFFFLVRIIDFTTK